MNNFFRLFLLLILFISTLTTNLPAAITDGLVSYWPLDVDQGGTTPDLSFANTLTIAVGAPAVVTGQYSNAFTFDGSTTVLTNQHTYDNTDSGLSIVGAGAYTISLWVKGAAQTARYIFTEANTTNNNPLLIIQTGNVAANNSKLDILLRNNRNQALINHVVSTNVVFDNNWHHIAFVDDRGFPKLYIDGNPDGTTTNSNFNYLYSAGDVILNTTALGNLSRLATNAPANTFNGLIDEVATWERALSRAEIDTVRTNGVFTPGTLVPSRPLALTRVPADATKRVGEWHLLSVDPTGNRPLTYQWSKNGSPILDGTSRYYRVLNLQTNNTGDFYSVAVTNPGGFAITTNITLTVLPDAAPDLTNGLVDYWPLDIYIPEDTNLVSPELHFGHRMVMRNMDTNSHIVPGVFSNAFFTIANLTTPTYGVRSNGIPIYTRTNYTVALWVKGNGVGQSDRRVFSEGRDGGNNNPLFTLGTDNAGTTASAYPFVRSDGNVNASITARLSTRPVFDDAWHHLVWTDANGQGKLYVDGALDETDYNYIRPALTLNLTMIGVTARAPLPVTPFTGAIDEVATWDRVLSWTEIQRVMTNGIPIPEGIIAPSIAIQPIDKTNNIFVGDNVNFTVVANGSLPFGYQWRKANVPISGGLNPSALTDTLTLPNVQLVDSNTTYSVVITNPAGSATSSVVRLYVKPWSPSTNGEVLKVDIDLGTLPDLQPGFASMTLGASPQSFDSAVKVTLSPVGTALAERHRTAPTDRAVVNNPPLMTQAQLYNDFIFANSTVDGTGLQLLIERLAPNTKHGVTLWSFDAVSTGQRLANWNEISSGTPIPITNSWTIGGVPVTITNDVTYFFDGNIMPTNDFVQTLGALLTSSTNGTLQFEAIKTGGTSFGAFLNAVRVVANPTATRIRDVNLVGSNLRVTVEGEYPGQPISLQEKADLNPGAWAAAVGASVIETRGPLVIFEVPAGPGVLFYRAVSYLP